MRKKVDLHDYAYRVRRDSLDRYPRVFGSGIYYTLHTMSACKINILGNNAMDETVM